MFRFIVVDLLYLSLDVNYTIRDYDNSTVAFPYRALMSIFLNYIRNYILIKPLSKTGPLNPFVLIKYDRIFTYSYCPIVL